MITRLHARSHQSRSKRLTSSLPPSFVRIMAPKGMKRPAAAAAGAPAKVQKTMAGFAKKCEAIIDALEHAEDVPECTRNLLRSALPHSIAVPKISAMLCRKGWSVGSKKRLRPSKQL